MKISVQNLEVDLSPEELRKILQDSPVGAGIISGFASTDSKFPYEISDGETLRPVKSALPPGVEPAVLTSVRPCSSGVNLPRDRSKPLSQISSKSTIRAAYALSLIGVLILVIAAGYGFMRLNDAYKRWLITGGAITVAAVLWFWKEEHV